MSTSFGAWDALLWRSVAYLIDIVFLFAGILLTQFLLKRVNPLIGTTRSPAAHHAWITFTVTFPVWLYFVFCYASNGHATLGMHFCHLMVTSASGAPVSFSRAALRAAVLLIPFELNHAVLFHPRPIWTDERPGFRGGFVLVGAAMGLYLGLIPLTPRQQSAHDLVAGTVVISTRTDARFMGVQERGRAVMGVDQYTSSHVFEDLPDGGRIVLDRDSAGDSAGVATIRKHMRDIADAFRAGDFTRPFEVHGQAVPGTDIMTARRDAISYSVVDRPGGAEVDIRTTDSVAVAAVHQFLAFQRQDHRAAGHEGMKMP